ncbi:hypothetical protein [Chryseobacterium sp. SIMBA_029]
MKKLVINKKYNFKWVKSIKIDYFELNSADYVELYERSFDNSSFCYPAPK